MTSCHVCGMEVPKEHEEDLQCHVCDKDLPCLQWRKEMHEDETEPYFCDTCDKACCSECILLVDEEAQEYCCVNCYEN